MRAIHTTADVWHVLTERGLVLTEIDSPEAYATNESLVLFCISGVVYSLVATRVCALLPLGEYTPLPLTQAYVIGLKQVQEHSTIILDIRPLLNLTPSGVNGTAWLVVICLDGANVALLVDQVLMPNVHDAYSAQTVTSQVLLMREPRTLTLVERETH